MQAMATINRQGARNPGAKHPICLVQVQRKTTISGASDRATAINHGEAEARRPRRHPCNLASAP